MVRFKNRYCLVELDSQYKLEDFNNKTIYSIIENSIKKKLGIINYCKVIKTLKIIYCNSANKLIVLRVSKSFFKILKNSLFFINKFENQNLRLSIIFCSGSIIKCQKKICEYLLINNIKDANINLNN